MSSFRQGAEESGAQYRMSLSAFGGHRRRGSLLNNSLGDPSWQCPFHRCRPPWPSLPILRQVILLARLPRTGRSEEHTSELQSHHDLVCRLLLEKKKF